MGIRQQRPTLVAVGIGDEPALAGEGRRKGWDVVQATGIEHAHFLVQHACADVVLVAPGPGSGSDGALAGGITAQEEVPVIFLTETGAPALLGARALGMHLQLPRQLACANPELLGAALEVAVRWRTLRRELQEARSALGECRRHAQHLAGLLWEVVPVGGPVPWYSQRHMMERLEEEVARAERSQLPLSIAVGEVNLFPADRAADSEVPTIRTWLIDRVTRAKRRGDIAGQYGPQGFLLLLPSTPVEGAGICCRRLQALLEGPGDATMPGRTRVQIGIAGCSPAAPASGPHLLRLAEECLERARCGAGDRVVF